VYNIGDFHQLKRKKKFETKKDWRKKSAVFALKKRQKNCFCAQQHQPWTVKKSSSKKERRRRGTTIIIINGTNLQPSLHPYNIFFSSKISSKNSLKPKEFFLLSKNHETRVKQRIYCYFV
jgi:hypothetical protein